MPLARPRIETMEIALSRARRTMKSGTGCMPVGPGFMPVGVLERLQEVVMRHEEAGHGAVEDNHLHVRIRFELVENLHEFAHFSRTHDVQGRVVERHDPVGRALPRDADLRRLGLSRRWAAGGATFIDAAGELIGFAICRVPFAHCSR